MGAELKYGSNEGHEGPGGKSMDPGHEKLNLRAAACVCLQWI